MVLSVGGIMFANDDENYYEVTMLLNRFKVPMSMLGFEYLRSAVLGCLNDDKLNESITKNIYPFLAEKYNTNVQHVERNIRNAIQRAYELDGFYFINEIFDMVIYNNKYSFSNGEMIFILVGIMKIKIAKKQLAEKEELQQVEERAFV